MEHRIGQRHPTHVSVYIRAASGQAFCAGILSDVSISGAFIRTSLMAEPLTTVVVEFSPDHGLLPAMSGQVVRRTPLGLGIEWAEYATDLVRTLTRPVGLQSGAAAVG